MKSTNLTSWRNSFMAKLSPLPDPQLRASAEPILVRDQEEVPRSWFVGHSTNPQSWRKTLEPIDGSYEKVFPASKKRKFVEEQNFSGGGGIFDWNLFSVTFAEPRKKQQRLSNGPSGSNSSRKVRQVPISPAGEGRTTQELKNCCHCCFCSIFVWVG